MRQNTTAEKNSNAPGLITSSNISALRKVTFNILFLFANSFPNFSDANVLSNAMTELLVPAANAIDSC